MTAPVEPPDTPEAAFEAVLAEADADPAPPTFDAPWQARAFGLAVALCRAGRFEWGDFQGRLVERLDATDPAAMEADVEGVYYRAWMGALEDLLEAADVLTAEELDARQADFGTGDRDASEFVRTDDLPERE